MTYDLHGLALLDDRVWVGASETALDVLGQLTSSDDVVPDFLRAVDVLGNREGSDELARIDPEAWVSAEETKKGDSARYL
jgi:hypothetical protein